MRNERIKDLDLDIMFFHDVIPINSADVLSFAKDKELFVKLFPVIN